MPLISEFIQRTSGNKNPVRKFNLTGTSADIQNVAPILLETSEFSKVKRKIIEDFWFQGTDLISWK